MSVTNIVKNIKQIHPEYIALIKIGKFYYSYGKDAYIISYIFNYKKIEENICVCAFPVSITKKIIAKIKIIDFLLNLCYDKQIINSKRYVKFGEKIDDILKYTIGWMKTINKN